jgi:uncharacterized protein DUF4190
MSENLPEEALNPNQPFTEGNVAGSAHLQDPVAPEPAYGSYAAQAPASHYPPTGAVPQVPGAHPANVYLAAMPVGSNGQPFSNGLGTAAMVLGIIGVTLFWAPFVDFICPVLALIFGWVGLNKVKNGTASNKGSAITGLVLGGISLAGSLIVVISLLSLAATVSTYHSY